MDEEVQTAISDLIHTYRLVAACVNDSLVSAVSRSSMLEGSLQSQQGSRALLELQLERTLRARAYAGPAPCAPPHELLVSALEGEEVAGKSAYTRGA